MKYKINHSNGKSFIVDDKSVNDTLSISIIGQSYKNYNNLMFDSLGKIVSNFANKYSPKNPIIGQFWYEKEKELNYYDGTKWKELKPMDVDMSIYVVKTNDTMTGTLTLSPSKSGEDDVASTREYIDSKKFKFKEEYNGVVSFVRYDNDYTILNTLLTLDAKNKSKVEFPYSMKDLNYAITLTKNSSNEEGTATYINSYKKTVNGFRVIANGTVENVGCIVMGYMTNTKIELPKSSKVIVIQLANENAVRDDNFEISLNDNVLGLCDFSKDEQNGYLFIASIDESISVSSGDFTVPLDKMITSFFKPSLIKNGTNSLKMKNVKTNNAGNAGIVGIRGYILDPDKTLHSPLKIADLKYAGGNNASFDFTFDYDPNIGEDE
jgi:hypothetical protein